MKKNKTVPLNTLGHFDSLTLKERGKVRHGKGKQDFEILAGILSVF